MMQDKTWTNVIAVLKRSRKRIEDPSRWTQGKFRRTRAGQGGYCYCAAGSVRASSAPHNIKYLAIQALRADVPPGSWPEESLYEFNDNANTTHQDILDLYDRTIARLESYSV